MLLLAMIYMLMYNCVCLIYENFKQAFADVINSCYVDFLGGGGRIYVAQKIKSCTKIAFSVTFDPRENIFIRTINKVQPSRFVQTSSHAIVLKYILTVFLKSNKPNILYHTYRFQDMYSRK